MDKGSDFLAWLGTDAVNCVFNYLQDPADLVRATAISQSWRTFVIENGLSKNLCKRIYPEVSHITGIKERPLSPIATELDESSSTHKSTIELIEHKVYTYINQSLLSSIRDEKIQNTLFEGEVGSVDFLTVFKGKVYSNLDKFLVSRLKSNLCVIDEIKILPFQAFFQFVHPMYSSISVQFKFGYCGGPDEYNNVWTYISPKFPVQKENVLQCFKLSRPVLCIGGFFKIEYSARNENPSMDDWYHICKTEVQVIGRALSPVLTVDFALSDIANSQFVLNYNSKSQKVNRKCGSLFSRLCSLGKRFT